MIEDMNPVVPKMSFPDEGGAKFYPHIAADGVSGRVVGLYVEFMRGDSLHNDDVMWCVVCLDV